MMDKMDTMDKNGMEWTIDMDDAMSAFLCLLWLQGIFIHFHGHHRRDGHDGLSV
jgi:hypothetical protein